MREGSGKEWEGTGKIKNVGSPGSKDGVGGGGKKMMEEPEGVLRIGSEGPVKTKERPPRRRERVLPGPKRSTKLEQRKKGSIGRRKKHQITYKRPTGPGTPKEKSGNDRDERCQETIKKEKKNKLAGLSPPCRRKQADPVVNKGGEEVTTKAAKLALLTGTERQHVLKKRRRNVSRQAASGVQLEA